MRTCLRDGDDEGDDAGDVFRCEFDLRDERRQRRALPMPAPNRMTPTHSSAMFVPPAARKASAPAI